MKNNVKKMKYAIYEIDSNLDKIIKYDEYLEELTGYNKNELKNISYRDLIPDEDKEEYFEMIENELVIKNKKELYLEHRILKKDGTKIYVLCLGHKNFDEKGNVISSTIRVFDLDQTLAILSKEKEVEKVLDKVDDLQHDELTGLLRRKPYIKIVNDHLKKKVSFAFFMIDIDDFKSINDTYGHDLGDKVLIEVAKVLNNVHKNATVCRLGGDEFSILIPNIKDDIEAIKLANKLNKQINKLKIEGKVNLTISIGLTLVTKTSKYTYEELYKKTDKVLYVTKNHGKNSYTICE